MDSGLRAAMDQYAVYCLMSAGEWTEAQVEEWAKFHGIEVGP